METVIEKIQKAGDSELALIRAESLKDNRTKWAQRELEPVINAFFCPTRFGKEFYGASAYIHHAKEKYTTVHEVSKPSKNSSYDFRFNLREGDGIYCAALGSSLYLAIDKVSSTFTVGYSVVTGKLIVQAIAGSKINHPRTISDEYPLPGPDVDLTEWLTTLLGSALQFWLENMHHMNYNINGKYMDFSEWEPPV